MNPRIGIGPKLALAALLLFGTQTARANTYSFSFTTADALSALATSDPYYLIEGYFALFLQPLDTQIPINTYSYSDLSTPKDTGPDRWHGLTIVDPSNPVDYSGNPTGNLGPGRWARFSKAIGQTQVTLVSGANTGPGGENIFLVGGPNTYSYSDNGVAPFAFGPTVATISSVMPTDGIFRFSLTLDQPLTGPVTFRGFASGIGSFDDDSFDLGGKTDVRAPFTLILMPGLAPVPEPSSIGLFSAGTLLAGLWGVKKRRGLARDPQVPEKPAGS